ncbi:MAG: hypothetical protein AB1634_07910 [Thermodesulfobacteriota bacterium]
MKRQAIEDALGDEIKQDIAERYFGFRKLIEEEEGDFQRKVQQYTFILEKRISFDLVRLYILLKDEGLIHAFLALCGIDQELYYDPYLTESPTIRARVFEGLHMGGLTRFRRFRNLVFECYDRLEGHVRLYREKLQELELDLAAINADISQFSRQNDLSAILGFFHSLGDSALRDGLEGGLEPNIAGELAARLELRPLPPVSHYLTVLPPIPPLDSIRQQLHRLASQAFLGHTGEEIAFFTSRKPPVSRPGQTEGTGQGS